jgi:hypothetical protein
MRQPVHALVRWSLGLFGGRPATSTGEVYSKRWEDRPFPGDGI